jgi:Calcineurin-like phosphoesterase
LRTLIVSDLHLGSASRVDLLRRPEPRAALLDALRDVQRLVLLGDVLELRHGPRHEALAAARPFFEDLGRALAGREIVVLAGNHDHALVEPWLERRGELAAPGALSVEQRFAAQDASPMLAQLAAWAEPARLTAAYPGLWVREDVYATHGHYLDCHLTVPTMERLGIGTMGRVLRRPAGAFTGPDDYEAVTNPVFAWIDAIARQATTGDALNGGLTVRAWRALRGVEDTAGAALDGAAPGGAAPGGASGGAALGGAAPGGAASGVGAPGGTASDGAASAASRNGGRLAPLTRALRTRALAGAFPLAVAALNRAGFGPFNADLSSGELRRAGLRAMSDVATRLGLGEAYVVFGHTHRAGPLPGDRASEWRGAAGARLINSGCWTYDSYFLTATPGESPYWPGCAVLVEDDGEPRLLRLLADRAHGQLAPAPAYA